MTIKEIKKIRATVLPTEQEYFDANSVEMVDTLLAEVERLREAYNDVCTIERVDVLQGKLTIATEVLERITEYKDQGNERECPYIARTALERIKE